MNLDVENWEEFKVQQLFVVTGTKTTKKENVYDSGEGKYPYVTTSSANNGVDGYFNIYTECGNVLTIDSACIGYCSYQSQNFSASDHIEKLIPRFKMNYKIAMFFVTIFNMECEYYNYGRKCNQEKIKNRILKLPVKCDTNYNPVLDRSLGYHKDGYIPDWEYMEKYIDSLHHNPITTAIDLSEKIDLDNDDWEEFYLHRVFNTSMGNGIDAVQTTSYNPKYNYVSRNSNDNGVVDFVDEIENEKPFPAGTMTLALGGSYLGACFVQDKPFYTAQNVGILQEKCPISIYTKLFIATVIRNECKVKYLAFGRELNSHFRCDFKIKLPIQHVGKEILIDETREFSDYGYIPDWALMDQYMKSFPYSDRFN